MSHAKRRNLATASEQRAAFPSRTNPDRPSAPRGSEHATTGNTDRSYPRSCNPNPARPPLNDAQRELTLRYLPLARAMAHRLTKSWPAGGDEFQSAASLAVVEAAQTFDPSRNIDFATFARFRIRGALIDVQRSLFSGGWRGTAGNGPRFQPLEADSESHGRVVGAQADEPVGADVEAMDAVENWLKKLSPLHAAAFRHIYLDGKTQEEAAALIGCSKSSICRLHRETLTWFQETDHGRAHRRAPQTSPQRKDEVEAHGRDRILSSWKLRSHTPPPIARGLAG